jgi:hypothetical protein
LPSVRVVVPTLEVALLIPLVAANPYRMTRENRQLRLLSLSLAGVLIIANSIAFGALVHTLVDSNSKHGTTLLVAALQVWLTNIIAFALLYWELDRGGPVARSRSDRKDLANADFRFSQDEDDDAADEVARRASKTSDWRPRFVDYLYVSITNSSAFSPTDTMPLSPRAKMLMSVEAVEALLTSVLVIARAVSQLS